MLGDESISRVRATNTCLYPSDGWQSILCPNRIQTGLGQNPMRAVTIVANTDLLCVTGCLQLFKRVKPQEMLHLKSQGLVIGNISIGTVKKHANHIFEKLGVEGRTSATLRAVEVLSEAQ